MDALNLIFGIVTILSFIYAFWVNRRLKRVQEIKETIITEIREIAYKIIFKSKGTNIEGYSDSIVSLCNSISPAKNNKINIGKISYYYYPFQLPTYMRTKCGVIQDDDEARVKKTLTAVGTATKKRAVYGPYKPLPIAGKYTAKFHIRLNSDQSLNNLKSDDELLIIDVFDYNGGQIFLNKKTIVLSDLRPYYRVFSLDFEYNDIKQMLEYRVEIIKPGISISIDYILVESCDYCG